MTDDSKPVIATAGLTKVFKDFWHRAKVTAVADLDLEVLPREVFGLLGPNGSGKSTTIKMILGLMFPTRGAIAVFGKRPSDVAVKSRIGFLPEETYLYPFLDARETLDYYGRLFHQPRRQRLQRIDMLLDMVGLSSEAYRRIGEYSKGMKRLIGMAQALINDPDLLILDEPTSGLDPLATRHFKDLVGVLAQRGKTVLLSSHLLADVEDVCDRVCVLYGGKRRATGTVDELLARTGKMQLTTDELDAQTLDAVEGVLSEHGRVVHEIRTPRNTLENVFLKIVDEARQTKVVTGGASSDGNVAEFLRGHAEEPAEPVGEEVIEALVSAPAESVSQQAPAPPAQEPPQPPPAEQVLDELIEPASQAPPPPVPDQAPKDPPPAQRDTPPAQPQVDRSVLEDLLGGNRPEGDQDTRE